MLDSAGQEELGWEPRKKRALVLMLMSTFKRSGYGTQCCLATLSFDSHKSSLRQGDFFSVLQRKK